MYSIGHIDLPKTSHDLFVTAEFDKKVTLWSLKKMKKITEIDPTLDFGGKRLVLVTNDEEPIIVSLAI